MYALDTVKQAAINSGVALRQIGLAMGKSDNYVSATLTNNSTPRADTLAKMLNVCGYRLAAVKDADITPEMLVIDGNDGGND